MRRARGKETYSPQRGSAEGSLLGLLASGGLEAAVVGVVGDLTDDFDEGGELDLQLGGTRELEDLMVGLGDDEVIDLEVLLGPDKVAAQLVYDLRGGHGAEVGEVFVGPDLTLGDDGLGLDGALARHEVDVVATQPTLADADAGAVLQVDICLVEVGLDAVGDLSRDAYEEAAAHIGEGGGVVAQRLVDGVQHVLDLLLEVYVVLYDVQLRVSRPGLEDAGVEVACLVDGLVAGSVGLQRVELLGALSGGDHVDNGIVAGITQLDLREAELIEDGLPHGTLHIVGYVHGAAVGDDDDGMRGGVGQLEEGVLHLQLVLHHGLLDIVEVLPVGCAEVDRGIAEERGRLGEGVDEVAEGAEVLDDLS